MSGSSKADSNNDSSGENTSAKTDFIRQIVAQDVAEGKWGSNVVTRFPPEPNAYLHIGHAKAVWTSYSIASDFGGEFHLRMDDTNPMKEEEEYVQAIQEDVRWLGCEYGEHLYYASDCFEQMHRFAIELIRKGKAYVDDQSPEEIRTNRGTLTSPGTNSPFRDRSVEENLDLFTRMKQGEFPDGSRVLRAKIDMTHPNINMRDPVMYRILHAKHPHRGDEWCIYPMYDWAHGLEDSIEGVTHSLCSIEFENHRPLYNWFIEAINEGREKPIHHPKQIEFARYNLTYTIMSKRKLRVLVEGGHVSGWDDPRLPTLRGMRRRGYVPEAIRDFALTTGISKYPAVFEIQRLEHHLRRHLNQTSPRVMGVLNPVKLVIDNYPEDKTETLEAVNNPEDPSAGTRDVPFSRELYIERDDFMEDPPRKFYRLSPGREVRLRYAYFVTCTGVIKDDDGQVKEIHCTYDPETRGGDAPDGRKVKATLHWVSARHAVSAQARLYEHLFTEEDPEDVEEGQDFTANLNPDSIQVLEGVKVEPSVAKAVAGDRCQFERIGYFCLDPDSTDGRLVFNRTVSLRDTWKKLQKKGKTK